ncbi:hypothetical protein [Sulfurimonas sp.]|uniref:hypothetical protein n=1 Tax=Sulfurimonas sp. TaxID=2022749 RepID=UPI0025D5028B|nr:hypothetical protein [Sulfurimonas sp.]MDD5156792.1 hypothetical protein [Sulfurimonas sp.]
MQKILKWLTPLIAIGVAIFLIFFFISINSNENLRDDVQLKHKSEVTVKELKQNWLDYFSKTEKLGYFYPVNEVFIKIDLNESVATRTVYKLSAQSLDPYQLFCLKEELKQHKLKYYLKQDKSGVELYVYSQDKEKLNSLVVVLKNYQISAKIGLIKEDI